MIVSILTRNNVGQELQFVQTAFMEGVILFQPLHLHGVMIVGHHNKTLSKGFKFAHAQWRCLYQSQH